MTKEKTVPRAKDLLLVRKAEKWMGCGQPRQALLELQQLTQRAWKLPLADRIIWRAAHTMSAL
jgi:hypothetical protein